MKKRIGLNIIIVFLLLVGLVSLNPKKAESQTNSPYTRQIAREGITSFIDAQVTVNRLQSLEPPGNMKEDMEFIAPTYFVNRSPAKGAGLGKSVNSGKKAKSNPELKVSFDGLNHRNQRVANGGNQFSTEPPDQGLCVGNGYVLESVNQVLRVYDADGNPLTGVVDLNTFYGYPAAINRTTGVYGPFVFDPSCYFDQDTQRWFQVAATLETASSNGDPLGPNHIDIAVSDTSSPLGTWTIYRLPVQNDGTQGTPDHGCSLNPDGTGHGPCLGDYPHIGADEYGFYITTNEYSFFGPEFKFAIIYAFSKRELATGGPSVTVVQFDTPTAAAGSPGFTVWPAISPAGQYRTDNGGTEFFLSADHDIFSNVTGESNRIFLWKLTNTSSLDTVSPSLSLSNVVIPVGTYAIPPLSNQKAGNFPLGQCLNDDACSTSLIGAPDPFKPEVISHLDSNDTRMQQVMYANGKIWGALDTAVTVNGVNKAGIEWFIINPGSNKVVKQGYLALANNNLTYPAVAVTPSGRGVIAFTVVGDDYYPSAGYASIDALLGVGDIHIAAAGVGPQDGFSGYKAFGEPLRPRWGDYGAAAVDGNTIWMASEYIAQTCTLAEYTTDPFGSCSGTRTAIGNWATRITQVKP